MSASKYAAGISNLFDLPILDESASLVSLDHLVGERDELVGNGKPERLGGFEVDDHLEYRGLRDR